LPLEPHWSFGYFFVSEPLILKLILTRSF